METHAFQDFDAFADSVRGVDSTMTLQNRTRNSWVINHASLPGIHVQLGRMGSGNIVEGQSSSAGYVLYLPLNYSSAYLLNGTVMTEDSFMVLEPGCEFDLASKAAHDWCSIFVPTHKLVPGDDVAEPSSRSEKMIARVTHLDHQIANQFRALVKQIMTTDANCPKFESAPAATSAAADLLKVASMVIGKPQGHEPAREGRPRIQREEIIRSSREMLEQRHGETVLVGDLAAAADVSERTLRRAFQEYFGVGPVRYLQLRQLQQVHRALRATDAEEASVTDVLLRHGVWEFGHFAARYRRLFGERPSETLRTRKAAAIFTGA